MSVLPSRAAGTRAIERPARLCASACRDGRRGCGQSRPQVRRTLDYVSAVLVVVVVSLSLYFLLTIANREGEPGLGAKGGEAATDSHPAPVEHAEKPV